MSLKQMDKYINRNIIFGMLRFKVFILGMLGIPAILRDWPVIDICWVHSRCWGPANVSIRIQSTLTSGVYLHYHIS